MTDLLIRVWPLFRASRGAEGHHRGVAGVGFGRCLAEGFLAGGNHHYIGGAVEGAQDEVVMRVSCDTHGHSGFQYIAPQEDAIHLKGLAGSRVGESLL
jgi:hypothetical protein